MKISSLWQAPVGSQCKVKEINLNKTEKERILDLGMIPETNVKVLQKSPMGDPTAYLIRGSVIALRSEYTKKITIEKI